MATEFREAVTSLISLQAEIAAVSASDNQHWKSELIALRKKLQDQLTRVRQVAAQCEPLLREAQLARRFENELSKMRSALAFHQAAWPAVTIDLSNNDYQLSVAQLREANRVFSKAADEVMRVIDAA